MEIISEPKKDQWTRITSRPQINNEALEDLVGNILKDVKDNGDTALRKYNLRFDGVQTDALRVTEKEFDEAEMAVSNELKKAIILAKNNIEKFHIAQIEDERSIETTAGVFCWRKSVPIEKVGLYIPGGSAPLFSTLLMLGIPAIIAGCKVINVCTPPGKDGKINPVILFVANLLGLKNVFKTGGTQAIAAMAYGTATISAVHKIFGPGNQYVTCAKQLVTREGIAIDMPAGPSELAVYADESCEASFVAADLLSQAEHGADSQVLLVASSPDIIDNIKIHIETQARNLSRKELIERSLQNSRFVILKDVDEAFALLNEYAPEHLIIATDKPDLLADKVINAGSVFLGNYSPESAGDYASGTNHTLPTNGFAKVYSGVSLDSFVKKITFQKLSQEGVRNIGNAIEQMAKAEGLDAHAEAIRVRLNK
jgi:histidinol dehydrogenase